MTDFPKPTAGATTGEFISFKRDMIPKRPVRAVADSAVEIGTRMLFDGQDLIDPAKLVLECRRYGTRFDHWWGKANCWKSQRGRESGSGLLLMMAGDYANIKDPLHPTHNLTIISGADLLTIDRLCVLEATVALGSGGGIGEDTPLLLRLGDARAHAVNMTAINNAYNLRQHDGKFDKTTGDENGNPVSSQRIVRDIWEDWLEELFGAPLNFVGSVSESVPNIDNLLFQGWTAWDAFWYVLDLNGWDFAIRHDGAPWVFKHDEANPQEALHRQAVSRALIQNYRSADRSPLPETLTVIAPTRDYQWYREAGRLTPQDHWRRYPTFTLDFSTAALVPGGIDSSRIVPASNQIVWCPRPAISNDQFEFVNEPEITGFMQDLATSRAIDLVSADTSDEHEFALLWDFQPGTFYQAVEWCDVKDGLVTRVMHTEQSAHDANSDKLIPIDLFDYHEPTVRWIVGLVQLGSSPSGNPDIPSDNGDVQPNKFCKVNVLSGHLAAGVSNWIPREQVDAINVTDGSIKAGARVFAVWNYQVGEGGAWCIVTASETPIKVDDLALLRIIGPVNISKPDGSPAGNPTLGAAIFSDDCLYEAQILNINKHPCDETWEASETVMCFDFRAYLPKAVLSFGEIYLGLLLANNVQVEQEDDDISNPDGTPGNQSPPSSNSKNSGRRLFGIVAETPNLQRVRNTSQKTLKQFRPAEVVGVFTDEGGVSDFAHHHLLAVKEVEGDYVNYCILAFDLKYNEVGWAWTHGTCPAYLAMRNSQHKWADSRSGTEALTSGHEGSARIIQQKISSTIDPNTSPGSTESNLGLVQLGELEDVAVCGKLYADLAPGSIDGIVETEGRWFEHDVHYDCVKGCTLQAETQVLIQFSRVAKFWRIIGFPPALRTGVGTTCIGVGSPPEDNDCMEKIVWMKGLKANYDIEMINELPVRRIKVGPNGIDGAITYVTNIVCSNGVITFTKRTLTFECGIAMSDISAGSDETNCCEVLAGQMPNPELDECMCCGDCPDCEECEQEYNVNLGSPFSGICDCLNGTALTVVQTGAGLCDYETTGGATPNTGCLTDVPCDFPEPPIEDEDPPRLRCDGDPEGELCIDCTEAGVGLFCCPEKDWGLRRANAHLYCEDGQWILTLEGGSPGVCPNITWNAMGSKGAGGQCPTGTYQMEFTMDYQCDEDPGKIVCNEPRVFIAPVTVS